jgi:hypothetical protein
LQRNKPGNSLSATPPETILEPKRKIMPLTTLDTTAALIVIDLQKGIVSLPTVHPTSEIIDRAAKLARAFRRQGLPVVLVNVTGAAPGRTDAGASRRSFPPDWIELVPELEQHPDDHIVSKQRLGAFIGTSLNDYLRQRGVTQVFLQASLRAVAWNQRHAAPTIMATTSLLSLMRSQIETPMRTVIPSRRFFPGLAKQTLPITC